MIQIGAVCRIELVGELGFAVHIQNIGEVFFVLFKLYQKILEKKT